tara:strand:- start:42 stop:1133 length:1092 start_codon:yes stop_codon:yes gene_type:complete
VILNEKSKNQIITFNFPHYIQNNIKEKFDNYSLKKFIKIEDKFDKYLINILYNLFPKLYLEDFNSNYQNILNYFSNFKSAKYIINESFLDDDFASFCISLINHKYKIKHIYIEHNYLSHPFIGNRIKNICNVVDKMFTLGWESKYYKKALKGSSLYEFNSSLKVKKKYPILYISHMVQNINFSLRNVMCGDNGLKYYFKMKDFFLKIPNNVLKRIYHKPYPENKLDGTNIKIEDVLHSSRFNLLKKLENNLEALYLIPFAKLCLIDHLSTTFIMALKSNTPTICLWHKSLQPLKKEFRNHLDILKKNNIVFDDIYKASNFIVKIHKNPDKWWSKKQTQNARLKFINQNIEKEDFMINKIISIN